jgi:hypothetical protein
VSSTSWANSGGIAHGSAPLAVVTGLTLTGRPGPLLDTPALRPLS